MDDATQAALISAVVSNLVIPLLLILGGYLMTLVPGPLRAWLASGTHQRDMELLLGAMSRKAVDVLTATGPAAVPSAVAAEAIAYAKANLPEVLAKLAPSDEALRTIATDAVAGAMAKLAPVVAAAGKTTGLEGRGA